MCEYVDWSTTDYPQNTEETFAFLVDSQNNVLSLTTDESNPVSSALHRPCTDIEILNQKCSVEGTNVAGISYLYESNTDCP